MNRALIATLVATIALVGCATSVDDPTTDPPAPGPGKDPPVVVDEAQLRQPASQFEIVVQDTATSHVPQYEKQVPNLPGK
jgi:hypothetical protein